jgi:hypothetical protein
MIKAISAVAFISPQNHPILIHTFNKPSDEAIKYHYAAHTSLDVIEERIAAGGKNLECYLGLLYVLEDLAVYGYITPLKVRIVVALPLTDSVVRDTEMIQLFKALHMAYYASIANPFLRLDSTLDSSLDHTPYALLGGMKWGGLRRRVDEIGRTIG